MQKAKDLVENQDKCGQHYMPLISFCSEHSKNLCSLCAQRDHLKCKKIDYYIKFPEMSWKFSFENIVENCRLFFDKSLEIIKKLQIFIHDLEVESASLDEIKVKKYLDGVKTVKLEINLKGKIKFDCFIKEILKKYTIIFQEKCNEIFKNLVDVQKEIRLMEYYNQTLHEIRESENKINNNKKLYEIMKEIEKLAENIVKIISYEPKLKNLSLEKICNCNKLDFSKFQPILKELLLELDISNQ